MLKNLSKKKLPAANRDAVIKEAAFQNMVGRPRLTIF